MTIEEIRAQYPQYDQLTDAELSTRLHRKFYPDMPFGEFAKRIKYTPPGHRGGGSAMESSEAFNRGLADMLTLGTSNKIRAGLKTGFGFMGDYEGAKANEREIDVLDSYLHPGATVTGNVAGAVSGPASAAKSGLTLMGRNVPGLSKVAPKFTQTALGAAEGAGYAGAYTLGKSDAPFPERLQEAGNSAAVGAVTGAVGSKFSQWLASRATRKASKAATMASSDFKDQAGALYEAARNQGVIVRGAAVEQMRNAMRMAGGLKNKEVRPFTRGMLREINSRLNGPMTLDEIDDVRKSINRLIGRANPEDQRTLMAMRDELENAWYSWQAGTHIAGDINAARPLWKEARNLTRRQKKLEVIEQILDEAEVKGNGKYTQAGVAQATAEKMKQLYNRISRGKEKSFSPEEVEMIRMMAQGKTSGILLRTLAKFSPKGVISFTGGQLVGSAIPGGNILVPGAGYAAEKTVEKRILRKADELRNSIAGNRVPTANVRSPVPATSGLLAGSFKRDGLTEEERLRRAQQFSR